MSGAASGKAGTQAVERGVLLLALAAGAAMAGYLLVGVLVRAWVGPPSAAQDGARGSSIHDRASGITYTAISWPSSNPDFGQLVARRRRTVLWRQNLYASAPRLVRLAYAYDRPGAERGDSGIQLAGQLFLSDCLGRGRRQVIVASHDLRWFEARAQIFDASNGELLAAYVHPGHFRMALAAVEGRAALVGWGVNNAVRRQLEGAAPDRNFGAAFCWRPRAGLWQGFPYAFEDLPPAGEAWYWLASPVAGPILRERAEMSDDPDGRRRLRTPFSDGRAVVFDVASGAPRLELDPAWQARAQDGLRGPIERLLPVFQHAAVERGGRLVILDSRLRTVVHRMRPARRGARTGA